MDEYAGGISTNYMTNEPLLTRGLELMVGNMFGTSLAMLPALVVAQRCSFVDLDGPLHLVDDHLPALRYEDGLVSLPQTPIWGSPRA